MVKPGVWCIAQRLALAVTLAQVHCVGRALAGTYHTWNCIGKRSFFLKCIFCTTETTVALRGILCTYSDSCIVIFLCVHAVLHRIQ